MSIYVFVYVHKSNKFFGKFNNISNICVILIIGNGKTGKN